METNLITPVSVFTSDGSFVHAHMPTHRLICCSFICIMFLSSGSPHFYKIQSNNTPDLNSPSLLPSTLSSSRQGMERTAPAPLRPAFPLNLNTSTHAHPHMHARSRAGTRTGDLPAVSGKTRRLHTLDHAERICLWQNSKKQMLGSETAAPSGQSAQEPGCSEPNMHPSGLH